MSLIYLVAYIILFGLFKNNRLARFHYLRHLRQLEKQYRLRLNISKISIKASQGIVLKGVFIQFKTFVIKIDLCLFNFSFLGLVSNGLHGWVTPTLMGTSIDQKEPIDYNFQNSGFPKDKNVNWDKRFFLLFKKTSQYLFKRQIKLKIFKMCINYHKIHVELEQLILTKNQFAFDFKIHKNKEQLAGYQATGSINSAEQNVTIQVVKKTIGQDYLTLSFDELEFIFHQKQLNTEISTEFEVSFVNLQILDNRICPERLKIDNAYLYVDLQASSEKFVIGKESGGSIGEIPFAFTFAHQYSENDILTLGFSVEVSQKLLTSCLAFHKIELGQVKVDGKLVLDLQLILNVIDPFQSYFSLTPISNSLYIVDLGNFNLSILNNSLMEIVECKLTLENLLPRKLVSEVSTNQVADNFLTIIVATEDYSFYEHFGVNPDAIGYALVSNIAKKTFSRGASTITMQVARNLFLNSEKNIVRKIEEILISLIIEKHCNIPKKRILEIYINIIEFGPGIYGIAQASKYYFGKTPGRLTVTESIVLSYVVPRPKHFHEALLIKTPQLLENLPRYFKQISKELVFKNLITEDEFRALDQEIIFANELGSIIL